MFTGPGARARPRRLHPVAVSGPIATRNNGIDVSFLKGAPPFGLTVANGPIGNTQINIAAGAVTDTTGVALMKLPTSVTKTSTGTFQPGNGNTAMGNGLTITSSTWYHIMLFEYQGNPDIYFDTSATAANMPGGSGIYRRIGSFRTVGSAAIAGYSQVGNQFLWNADDAGGSAWINTTTTATAQSFTVTTPPGVKTLAILRVQINGTTGSVNSLISPLDQIDQSPAAVLNLSVAIGGFEAVEFPCRTNTSAQVRVRSGSTAGSLYGTTAGWIEFFP